jgi:MYXO-CTERM domain-containing protein
MKSFTYVLPRTLDEASLAAKKPGALLKAAGIDVVDRQKERKHGSQEIVNLLPMKRDLSRIDEAQGCITIGALATLALAGLGTRRRRR